MAQVWVYNEALGGSRASRRPQPSSSGATGRAAGHAAAAASSASPGSTATRSATPDTARRWPTLTTEALDWVRRLRRTAPAGRCSRRPRCPSSTPRPQQERRPWHGAKRRIAAELGELTLLPAMNPERRRAAHARGIRRWDDPRASAATLDIPDKWADQHDAVLAVNRPGAPVVLPERITGVPTTWRTSAPLELYVDFETVSNLDDDFSALPAVGGQALIFQIGCGRWEAGEWRFRSGPSTA